MPPPWCPATCILPRQRHQAAGNNSPVPEAGNMAASLARRLPSLLTAHFAAVSDGANWLWRQQPATAHPQHSPTDHHCVPSSQSSPAHQRTCPCCLLQGGITCRHTTTVITVCTCLIHPTSTAQGSQALRAVKISCRICQLLLLTSAAFPLTNQPRWVLLCIPAGLS